MNLREIQEGHGGAGEAIVTGHGRVQANDCVRARDSLGTDEKDRTAGMLDNLPLHHKDVQSFYCCEVEC